jgi:tRNA threonylcarbamoyl adenosine modification protein (Sua5/YciO/YrdC/YwlC family)
MAILYELNPDNPQSRSIEQITSALKDGAIMLYPTDTVYAMGCDIKANKSIDKIARLKGLNPLNPDMSLIYHDMSQLSEYTVIHDNNLFRLLKHNLPGPFTFIVPANNQTGKSS